MTNEEMKRTMEFIVEQNARSSTKVDALAEVQKRAEERWAQTEESIRAPLSKAIKRHTRRGRNGKP